MRSKMDDLSEFNFPDAKKLYTFFSTVIDMFGPFYIEDKKPGAQMHYLCLFAFFDTRVVHLEACHDLSANCLLMAIRKLLLRNG